MSLLLKNYSSKNDINICQIVAYKDNKLKISVSKHGYKKEDTLTVMSVTKSITSLLIGIAIDKGFIKSENDYVMDYYKDYTPKRGEKAIYEVTIKQLLTMTAPSKGKSEPWKKVCTSNDWTYTTLDILGGRNVTNEFKYRTLIVQILLGIIKNSSNMNVLDFANCYLFSPLGIEKRTNANCFSAEAQKAYVMSKEDHGKVWFLDPTGMPTAGWGLSLSAFEMAQIGLMVLNKGIYKGQRIISEEWISKIGKSYCSLDFHFGNQDYGYLWWLPHRTSNIIAAIGDGGNVIYVNYDKNIVVAITAYFKPLVFDRIKFIEENIVKAID